MAADAFRAAQKAEPGFALAYWGEAMSFNHPLWAQQDIAAARKVLERLAPTASARPRRRRRARSATSSKPSTCSTASATSYARDVALLGGDEADACEA